MKILVSALCCAAFLAGCSTATTNYKSQPSDSKFAVGLGAGTTGITAEAKFSPNDRIALRGNYNFGEIVVDQDYDGIDYDGDLSLSTFGGFVDVAPFKNGFVLSGGAYVGDKTFDLNATPSNAVEIGGLSFDPSDVGTLTGRAEFNNFAPYAGIGYDSFISGSSNWSFNARAGVMFTGSVDVDLVSVNGLLSNDQTLRDEIEAEILAIEEDAENYKYYPVLTIGIARRF